MPANWQNISWIFCVKYSMCLMVAFIGHAFTFTCSYDPVTYFQPAKLYGMSIYIPLICHGDVKEGWWCLPSCSLCVLVHFLQNALRQVWITTGPLRWTPQFKDPVLCLPDYRFQQVHCEFQIQLSSFSLVDFLYALFFNLNSLHFSLCFSNPDGAMPCEETIQSRNWQYDIDTNCWRSSVWF